MEERTQNNSENTRDKNAPVTTEVRRWHNSSARQQCQPPPYVGGYEMDGFCRSILLRPAVLYDFTVLDDFQRTV